MIIYELNFYPTESSDAIIKESRTKAQAKREYKQLQAKYPNRTGSAFIRVWQLDSDSRFTALNEEPLYDIEL